MNIINIKFYSNAKTLGSSEIAHDKPPPPKSFIALIHFSFLASRIASMINFSINGSGICIAERFSFSNEYDANWEPPIPSRPVEPPIKTTKSPLLAWFLLIYSFFQNQSQQHQPMHNLCNIDQTQPPHQ